tara:strand:+ start:333 stop:605 length:273 start_codon:yes stop_codon:yes gene_type:complete
MKKIILTMLLVLFFSKPSYSGEITDIEWDVSMLYVTYYDGTNTKKIECTAFNSEGTPIGGGFGYTSGGVARIWIDTPNKYKRKNLDVKCK